mmetsp:Transcript_10745/g.16477  ORF Transcript_10745/g.16477 Transcript_10745/m.16477 type:complete len:243 (+) Transcript_10745:203-931(+)
MKFAVALSFLACSVSAFAPSQSQRARTSRLSLADVTPEEVPEEPEKPQYPTVNGWTADPTKFCAGLPGAVAPLGEFDPLGFTKDLPIQEIKRFREAEVTHGRVAMLASVGYLVAEKFHPFFGGAVSGPANSHLAQVQEKAPFFFAFLVSSIATWELGRAIIGWERPLTAIVENQEIEGRTWFTKLNDDYYPGDIGFDPLGLKPKNAAEFAEIQTKELNNGRLAMLAAIGMMVQEQVTNLPLF